jgi:hypothetical protein
MDGIQPQDVTKFVNWRKKSKLKNRTINHNLTVLGRHFIDYTRKQYAGFSPESASRAVLPVLGGGKNGTELAQAS